MPVQVRIRMGQARWGEQEGLGQPEVQRVTDVSRKEFSVCRKNVLLLLIVVLLKGLRSEKKSEFLFVNDKTVLNPPRDEQA